MKDIIINKIKELYPDIRKIAARSTNREERDEIWSIQDKIPIHTGLHLHHDYNTNRSDELFFVRALLDNEKGMYLNIDTEVLHYFPMEDWGSFRYDGTPPSLHKDHA